MQPPSFFAILPQAKRYSSFDGRIFYSNHPLSCSGGTRGTDPPSANFDDNLAPLAAGFQNSKMIFLKFGVANQIGVKKDKLSSFPVKDLFL